MLRKPLLSVPSLTHDPPPPPLPPFLSSTDPFLKKEWYDIKAPGYFKTRAVGKTLITRTTGTKIASEGLKGRVFEVNLAELQGGDEEQGYRKFQLVAEDVKGTEILTNFHGMDLTRYVKGERGEGGVGCHTEVLGAREGFSFRLSCFLRGLLQASF